MDTLLVDFLFLSGLTAMGVWIYYLKEEKKTGQPEKTPPEPANEEDRQDLLQFFATRLPQIRQAQVAFDALLAESNGYCSHYRLSCWREQYGSLYRSIKRKPLDLLPPADQELVRSFLTDIAHADDLRHAFNRQFIETEKERYRSFFNKVEGRSLDAQQRTAIVTDEDNNLVIAGAGSGKTTTIVGKVGYVLQRYNVPPAEILLLSFTGKSAAELGRRLMGTGVEASTFHKFGREVIREAEGAPPRLFAEQQFAPLLEQLFAEQCRHAKYLKQLTTFFTQYLKPDRSPFAFGSQGAYIQYLKEQHFRPYKLIEGKNNAPRREIVQSVEEYRIANFLLFNGIAYTYGTPYEFSAKDPGGRPYRPAFTLRQGEKVVYLEHWATARDGSVPAWFGGADNPEGSEKYGSSIQWKRELHQKKGTTLIETFSFEGEEGTLLKNLSRRLKGAGLELQPRTPEQIWATIRSAAPEEVDGFLSLLGTFITLMKANHYSLEEVLQKNGEEPFSFFPKRNALLLDLVRPLYEGYEQHLATNGLIDFSDMINRAADYIENGRYKRPFRYVIVDEFQDLSVGRYQLLKAIRTVHPSCRLFCVGDDWQSIFRFTGSDLSLFREFESYFGPTATSRIETTYRFHQPLAGLSGTFIQKNPGQLQKELKGAGRGKKTTWEIRPALPGGNDGPALKELFDHLYATCAQLESKRIYLLGRYGFDINRIKPQPGLTVKVRVQDPQAPTGPVREYAYEADKWKFLKENEKIIVQYEDPAGGSLFRLEAEFLTVHRAKGLEAEIAVVINCNAGKHGFPSGIADDPALQLVLGEEEPFEQAEERRLFYVAMTRAREAVYFLADPSSPSGFITELEASDNKLSANRCPRCGNAEVVFRKEGVSKNGSPYKFYSCTNAAFGCGYTKMEWGN
ncbi:UvrD-helicase domain-containing protein [Paraflavisolibacter sp. H34]|uniref:UvrD-helicase domain-containing protein n=1 Tax=Huijunlia imazamoxiresistens TaxID=3127457 RepID=UPI0030192133